MRRFIARLRSLFRGQRDEADAAREMSAHLAMLEEEHRRRGLSAVEAHFAARRAMGSIALARELHREARSFVWLEDLRRDLRHALRNLRRTPGFTLTAVLALGLGIGVNTAFFTIVDAICLRGLPIDAPERVMYVAGLDAQGRPRSLSYAEFDEMRGRTTAFTRVAAYTITTPSVADARQPPARVLGAYLSAGAFELLGDRPMLGRTFRPDEDNPGSPPVVIIGSGLWNSRYASDPGIIGQTISVNGVPSTVIGVMPRGFMFPTNADIWRPMSQLAPVVRQSRAEQRLAVFARLADGRTEQHARVEMASLAVGWAAEHPDTNRGVRMTVVPINEQLNPSVAQRAWIAFIIAGVLVLLVACANVANLLLMRAASRGREMAIRTAIGASRGRVVRQLLAESATLSALAATFGIAVAWAGLRMLAAIVPPDTLPYWMAFTIDGTVLSVVIGACVLSVFLCGLPSAVHVFRIDLRDAMTDSAAAGGSLPARRWIGALLAAEFAITLVLVTLAVTSVRGNIEARRAEFQINPESLLTMSVPLGLDLYPSAEKRVAFFEQLDEAVGSSVGSLAFASDLPYSGGQQQPVTLFGRSLGETPPSVSVVSASERYFEVLGIPLISGRAFSSRDGQPGAESAIVNERFVQMFLQGQAPIGARIRVGVAETPWLQIVGVATTVRQQAYGPLPDPVVFLPFRAAPQPVSAIIVRAAGESAATIATLRREAARLDPNLPIYRVMTFEQAVRNAFWNVRLSDTIIRSIAVVAFALALIGLYAVTGHTVQRWTKELAVRIALGAAGGQIGLLVMRRLLTQLSSGLALGLVATLAFDRLFSDPPTRLASRVHMMDAGALSVIVLSITIVAVIACLVPIRRATRIDPIDALRAS